MFYISNISGELVPFQPTTAVRPTLGEATAAVETGAMADTATDDSAIYEGHAVSRSGESVQLGHASNIAWAGAVRSYRIQAGDRVAEALPMEADSAIDSVEQVTAIDSALGESAQRVNPVRKERHRYPPPTKERKRAVTARDLMSAPVFTLREDRPIGEAQRVFGEHRYRHIPIVSAAGKLVGILSDRDFIGESPRGAAGITSVRERMVANVLTARPETEIQAIAEVMISHHIGCLPIVDENGALLGVLTQTDILRAIVNHAPIELWT